ncbi:MAG: GIY-YIG nuclease family protein [Bacteroidetes bacterium]|nr:GIY-YIG nuclease family protein [Bacteroidota bacterium]
MKPIGTHNYFVYITTNKSKKILYTGVTNNLKDRLWLHEEDSKTHKLHFTGKYNCFYLVYWERFQYIEHAIKREKQIKGWTRIKKEKLITEFNPEWKFLNDEIG